MLELELEESKKGERGKVQIPFFSLFKNAFRLFGKHIGAFLMLAIVFFSFSLILFFLVQFLKSNLPQILPNVRIGMGIAIPQTLGEFFRFIYASFKPFFFVYLGVVLVSIIHIFPFAFTVFTTKQIVENQPVKMGRNMLLAIRKFIPFFLMNLRSLTYLFVVIAFFLFLLSFISRVVEVAQLLIALPEESQKVNFVALLLGVFRDSILATTMSALVFLPLFISLGGAINFHFVSFFLSLPSLILPLILPVWIFRSLLSVPLSIPALFAEELATFFFALVMAILAFYLFLFVYKRTMAFYALTEKKKLDDAVFEEQHMAQRQRWPISWRITLTGIILSIPFFLIAMMVLGKYWITWSQIISLPEGAWFHLMLSVNQLFESLEVYIPLMIYTSLASPFFILFGNLLYQKLTPKPKIKSAFALKGASQEITPI